MFPSHLLPIHKEDIPVHCSSADLNLHMQRRRLQGPDSYTSLPVCLLRIPQSMRPNYSIHRSQDTPEHYMPADLNLYNQRRHSQEQD
jgi:hypothetical protein